ncbi:MAG: saccharopine dehydrogenase C-terminal domain-containing protein [Vicingaceae bacterium]
MKNKIISILGSGRSAFTLIEYLSTRSKVTDTVVRVYDRNATESLGHLDAKDAEAIDADLTDRDLRRSIVKSSDLIISMLPVRFHCMVAEDCIEFGKHMVTASYVTKEMEALQKAALNSGVTLLNEMGLDPGIDHMSAMKIIHEIQERGGQVRAFESFTGGLLAPESEENNPWQYKFTWNPRNVITAGSGGAVKFLDHKNFKFIPYHRVFRRTEIINLKEFGKFEGYANRDSLKYQELYGLEHVETMFRGTLRRPGFCKAWDVFVQIGATDDSYNIRTEGKMTHRSFINSFLKFHPTDSVELKLMQYLKLDQDDVDVMEKLEWLGIFKEELIEMEEGSPADILQYIVEKKWTLESGERDMIVMWHKFLYTLDNEEREVHSYMAVKGDDLYHTAMSKSVGLPVALGAELILNGSINQAGVLRPLQKEIYLPILKSLKNMGIEFYERRIA